MPTNRSFEIHIHQSPSGWRWAAYRVQGCREKMMEGRTVSATPGAALRDAGEAVDERFEREEASLQSACRRVV
ncbi:MAG: hypothetical protein IT365_05200 [Candidatus Hydrogenedentes bacterium]|nr:hypothetical protein [Candidatus Hydrogenedentota bacterium]